MRMLAAALVLLVGCAHAQTFHQAGTTCAPIRIGNAHPMNYNTAVQYINTQKLGGIALSLPYTVPDGTFLGVTDIQCGSKHIRTNGNGQNDYCVILGYLTVTSQQPHIAFSSPLVFAPGERVDGAFSSYMPGVGHWMTLTINGYLSTDPLFRDCR